MWNTVAIKNEKYIALPEKALLDELYMVSRGLRSINIEELDLRKIDRERLEDFAKRFPSNLRSLLEKIGRFIGSTLVTNEPTGRIA